jgi:Tol biopolymer transport system component
MSKVVTFAVLLATLAACPDHRGFKVVGTQQIAVPDGDKRGPSFSSLTRAFAFTLRDTAATDRVFLHNPGSGTAQEASTPADPEFLTDGDSFDGSTDATGQLVAFLSTATNLLPGGLTSGTLQAYLRDLVSGQTILLSQNDAGFEADAPVTSVRLAGNGRFVVFATAATNLMPAASNGFSQVYVLDLFTGTLQLVSADSKGVAGNGGSIRPAITPDGRFVAFETSASNLLAGDANGIADIYLYDRSTRKAERVTGAAGGTAPVLSHDALFVIFERAIGGTTQLFCRDRALMTTAQMTAGDGDSTHASISANGRFTAFQSDATDLVAGDTNGLTDVFVFDVTTSKTVRVSVSPTGKQGDGPSRMPSIMADGRSIAFASTAYNITTRDPSGFFDIFVFANPLLP